MSDALRESDGAHPSQMLPVVRIVSCPASGMPKTLLRKSLADSKTKSGLTGALGAAGTGRLAGDAFVWLAGRSFFSIDPYAASNPLNPASIAN